jgi:hypothetical protein
MSVFDSAASQYPAGAFFDDDAPFDDSTVDYFSDEQCEESEDE